jgi:hypothetical protein
MDVLRKVGCLKIHSGGGLGQALSLARHGIPRSGRQFQNGPEEVSGVEIALGQWIFQEHVEGHRQQDRHRDLLPEHDPKVLDSELGQRFAAQFGTAPDQERAARLRISPVVAFQLLDRGHWPNIAAVRPRVRDVSSFETYRTESLAPRCELHGPRSLTIGSCGATSDATAGSHCWTVTMLYFTAVVRFALVSQSPRITRKRIPSGDEEKRRRRESFAPANLGSPRPPSAPLGAETSRTREQG